MRRFVNVNVHTKSELYIIDNCDSAFYDKESDSIKIMKGNSTVMIPYREVLVFRTTFEIKE